MAIDFLKQRDASYVTSFSDDPSKADNVVCYEFSEPLPDDWVHAFKRDFREWFNSPLVFVSVDRFLFIYGLLEGDVEGTGFSLVPRHIAKPIYDEHILRAVDRANRECSR